MAQQLNVISQLCIKDRKAEKDNHAIGYQYTLETLCKLNADLIFVATCFNADTLQQIDVSHYSYAKKPTAYQQKILLAKQTEWIQQIVQNKQYIDLSVHCLEQDICALEDQFKNDAFNIEFLLAKQEKQHKLNDIKFFDYILPWYKSNGQSVNYATFKECGGLKKQIHYYQDNKAHKLYLTFKG